MVELARLGSCHTEQSFDRLDFCERKENGGIDGKGGIG